MGLADARDRARQLLADVAPGEDPQGKKNAKRQEPTFGELAEVYIEAMPR